VIFGFLTFMTALAAYSDLSMRPALAVCAAAWLFSYLWLFRFQFVINNDSVSYRSLFWGTCTYQLKEIKSIYLESGAREYSDRFKPFVRLAIVPLKQADRALYVNVKVLSPTGMSRVLETLRSKYDALGLPNVVRNF
jgi:hypothetical protein